ncbi:MAG: phenylalanine--tRNA ligase subunit beta [Cyanobacteriota bacterium]|nr:phenylalanine--tRNA ligase subunit beta [Cyanobacteriota bacterium]
MRVSLQWLRELVSFSATPEELAERLSIAGFEVEALEDLAAQAAGVVVGLVESCLPHPDAQKLRVCRVNVGQGDPLQIVCGAANVRAGIHVPVALVGTTLAAAGLTIKPAQLRGVASSGMICSLAELGLAEASEGIAILEDLLESIPAVGSAVGPCFGLDDVVLELAITANRPDGLSMQGIAREVAALTSGQTALPEVPPGPKAEPLPVDRASQSAIEAGGLFSITALEKVRVGTSPEWLRKRLERSGLRSINSVVDITNLVMLETGQPLHAFDRDKLARLSGGGIDPAKLGLRQAHAGERLVTLDSEARTLSPESLVVTYADRPVALAGVMGGLDEAVDAQTTAVWLEAAMFAPQAVRRSARSVGLRTEASSRFEKGLPREVTLQAADRALALLQQLCGAQVIGRWLHAASLAPAQPLRLRRDALHNLLGPVQSGEEYADLPDARVEQTLTALGCQLEVDAEGWLVTPPPARAGDLQREVDLIEEVARLVGYDHFAAHLPDPIEPGGLDPAQLAERQLRRSLCSSGLQELCSYSLVAAGPERQPLANPLLADYGFLRHSLLEELLAACRRNLQASQPGFWAFEIGTVFARSPELDAPQELQVLAGVIAGTREAEAWRHAGRPAAPDYHQARGVLQRALAEMALIPEDRPLTSRNSVDESLLHPGQAAELVLEGRSIGWFGRLHPDRAEQLDLPEPLYLFELPLAPLLTAATRPQRRQPSFRPFATVPAAERDLAVIVDQAVSSSEVLAAIRKAGKPLLEHAELIDRYTGAQVGEGRCSQAFRLRFRDPQRTLTDGQVEQAHRAITDALASRLKAVLRC